ncbi:MAG: type II toxin-antitoxin system RelE/ParE family toxin [Desulfobacterales bacterium]|nr:type II toxin-antitoxin system RelE/ParE family toxin [Desulfobacterales bacterium]
MIYKLKYHPDIKKSDLPKIDAKNRNMIKRAIEERLVNQPEMYGKPLQRTLKGYWKLRVGDYCVVFRISCNEIHILGIIHRKKVYQHVQKRIKP